MLHGGEVHTVAVNSDNTKIATGGKDGTVSVWNLKDLKQLAGTGKRHDKSNTRDTTQKTGALGEIKTEPRKEIDSKLSIDAPDKVENAGDLIPTNEGPNNKTSSQKSIHNTEKDQTIGSNNENSEVSTESTEPIQNVVQDQDDSTRASQSAEPIQNAETQDPAQIDSTKASTQQSSVEPKDATPQTDGIHGKSSDSQSFPSPILTLHNHSDTVISIHWSPKSANQLLSSDKAGNIYLTDVNANTSRLLYPQPEPVQLIDLTWSADARMVLWITSDSKIHVVDVTKNTYQELTQNAERQTSLVYRSIAFDPTNNYLIAVDDDTLMYVFQYKYNEANYQFRLTHKISKLINKNTVNVHYKRIDWSPDGELVTVPTASKNNNTVISLVAKSKGWHNKVSIVGHGRTCEVIKFSPNVYNASLNDNRDLYNLVATAGSDKSLCVWNTTKETPLFILQDIVERPVADLAWSKDGEVLVCASLDGHMSMCVFSSTELGYKVTKETFDQLWRLSNELVKPLTYKYDSEITGEGAIAAAKKGNVIHLIDQKDAVKITNAKKEKVAEAPVVEVEEQKTESETKLRKGSIVPEIADRPDITKDADVNMKESGETSKTSTVKTKKKPVKAPQKPIVQKVTTKNGKRRIQPTLISSSGSLAPLPIKDTPSIMKSSSKSLMEFDRPSYSVSDEFSKQNKRFRAGQDDSAPKKFKRELEPVKFIGSAIVNPSTTFAKVRLAVPKTKFNMEFATNAGFVLDVRNGLGNEAKPSRITYFKKDKQLWNDFVPRYIQLATEGLLFWALSTSDGQILTYAHDSGERLLPPLVLGAPISFLESHGKYLMAVSCIGELYVWDLENKKVELSTNLAPLLDMNSKFQEDGLAKAENITLCAVTSIGIPLVTLSNGSGYLYNNNMGTWQTVTESWWSFGSHYWDTNAENQPLGKFGDSSSIIELLEHMTNEEIVRKTRTGRGKYFNKISKNMIMKEGFENLENTISLSHLENRLLCCELLGENKDFHKYFMVYVQRLCELGFKAKLYAVCDKLLGPVSDEDDEVLVEPWDEKICGVNKRELLKEVILACAKHRDVQRVLLHFGRRIGIEGML